MTSTTKKLGLKSALRFAMPVIVLGGCVWLLSRQLSPDVFKDLPAHLAATPIAAWVCALLFTALSFFSLGRYDGLAHRHLRTGVPMQQARLSGMAGIAIAQTLGFGLVTGAFARWRILPCLTLPKALSVSAFVSVSFVVSWILVTATACLLLPAPGWAKGAGAAILLGVPVGYFVLFRWPELRLRGLTLRFPTLRASAALVFWTALDTAAAAAVLWILLPESANVSFAAFLPVFLLACGFALISNTPGGVGPFELALVSLLPALSADMLVQSIIAYRLVYYALPATLGAILLLRPLRVASVPEIVRHDPSHLTGARRSEAAVIRQNGGFLAASADGAVPIWPTAQTVTALFGAATGSFQAALATTSDHARSTDRLPLLYKISRKDACIARQAGWSVLHLADDALLSTENFSLETPSRRTLRRKLRNAAKAGVTVDVAACPGMPALAEIDAAWCARHGPARGGTMGRFHPALVAHQWCAIAYVEGAPVAFVTFFISDTEWALDLMRQVADAPDGTMHMLVARGIDAAKSAGARTVSLAATPACPNPSSALWRQIAKWVVQRAGGPGLRQFKSAFGPDWTPRYAAAPGPLSLALGLADIAREVHRPPALPTANTNDAHDVDENYEFDLKRSA